MLTLDRSRAHVFNDIRLSSAQDCVRLHGAWLRESASMWMLRCVSSHVCIYVEDLRPLSCAARGCVTSEDWRKQAERLLPIGAASLPGSPKFQVRALLGQAGRQRIDLGDISVPLEGCVALLVLRRDGATLCRFAKAIALLGDHILSWRDNIALAEFVLPRCAAQALERAIVRWIRHSEGPQDPTTCGIGCALEIWVPSQRGEPRVAQLRLDLDGIRCERNETFGLVGHLEFYPPDISFDINPCLLRVITCRPDFLHDGMHSAVVARAILFCRARDQADRLQACIEQACRAHNSCCAV